jgi:hypothetical protein
MTGDGKDWSRPRGWNRSREYHKVLECFQDLVIS